MPFFPVTQWYSTVCIRSLEADKQRLETLCRMDRKKTASNMATPRSSGSMRKGMADGNTEEALREQISILKRRMQFHETTSEMQTRKQEALQRSVESYETLLAQKDGQIEALRAQKDGQIEALRAQVGALTAAAQAQGAPESADPVSCFAGACPRALPMQKTPPPPSQWSAGWALLHCVSLGGDEQCPGALIPGGGGVG